MIKRISLFFIFWCSGILLFGQETFHLNGLSNKKSIPYLLKGAYVHINAHEVLDNADVLFQNGKIVAVGSGLSAPNGAVEIDLAGKHIYPAFVDAFSDYGMPNVEPAKGVNWYNNKFASAKSGPFNNNEAIKSENSAAEQFKMDKKKAEKMRDLGFATAWVHVPDGISRGTGAVVSFAEAQENESVLKADVGRFFAFDRGSSTMSFPISIMGMVSLLRQTYLDADWYAKGGWQKERNLSLEAFNASKKLKPVFAAKNVDDILRADFVGDEFNEQYLIKGNGDEYQKLDLIKKTGASLIVPIDFPEAEKFIDPLEAQEMELMALRHWNLAPSNPKMLYEAKIPFAISAGDSKGFFDNLRKAIGRGLPEEAALAALTSVPAEMMGLSAQLGKIEKGFEANILVTDKPVFDEKSQRLSLWISGKEYKLNIPDRILDERFVLKIGSEIPEYRLEVKQENGKNKFSVFKSDSVKVKSKIGFEDESISIEIDLDSLGEGLMQGFLWPDGHFAGKAILGNGETVAWSAKPASELSESINEDKKGKKKEEGLIAKMQFPFAPYGFDEQPQAANYLIRNATVWTNEKAGILDEADVLVKNGKIASVGKNLSTKEQVKEIDGRGMHLTSGIIDEHSHIALYSINELETVSAQVRQRDALRSNDINIYRQLAGGVTAAQLLHGSADCIGGQSALIKMKWGEAADGLLIERAPRFIKFALGENVKRGNAFSGTNRYPVTRMGVEQVYMDAFSRAKDYQRQWKAYNALGNKKGVLPPRKDLKMEALVDILNDDLHITCHSYVQSEINMLMHVADTMDFKINTFTHILEGYKVADKMKERGIYGSTFSDWWAYKFEVREAIPYNNAIMNKVGVKTAINSDDAEMARRLNQEAAKTMLYGGLSEEEAWKTVTLYPATMLHLDERMGSIKVGKDADLVLWNANPLSIYARPEFTMIEGVIYFDEKEYEKKTEEIALEKNQLIQAMKNAKGGKSGSMEKKAGSDRVHCDSVLELGGISLDEL
ncbi:amidohydrolase family protein [Marinilongibacter aquaticus]|uniref:amidohydrolase family protein n=1 Tax=Marinilongibacter aquaticus TaxID=2975157 RepID=UPI0021BD1D0C|nr:amidohydrolase family protein [Marinilongibacter aquaticus]UBM57469.1 amidohydrolase family protein [Marinilongibacter aquaticus]